MVLPVARLAKLVRHLTVAPEAVAAAPLVESTRQDEERALPMLSGQQMADFISKGYVLVQPNEGEGQELPAQFHASFYDRVEDLMRNPVHEGHRDLGQMTQEINQLLRAPSCHGALRSILGEGFSVASWGNGTPLLHNPQDTDQGWHKVRIRPVERHDSAHTDAIMVYPGWYGSRKHTEHRPRSAATARHHVLLRARYHVGHGSD